MPPTHPQTPAAIINSHVHSPEWVKTIGSRFDAIEAVLLANRGAEGSWLQAALCDVTSRLSVIEARHHHTSSRSPSPGRSSRSAFASYDWQAEAAPAIALSVVSALESTLDSSAAAACDARAAATSAPQATANLVSELFRLSLNQILAAVTSRFDHLETTAAERAASSEAREAEREAAFAARAEGQEAARMAQASELATEARAVARAEAALAAAEAREAAAAAREAAAAERELRAAEREIKAAEREAAAAERLSTLTATLTSMDSRLNFRLDGLERSGVALNDAVAAVASVAARVDDTVAATSRDSALLVTAHGELLLQSRLTAFKLQEWMQQRE